MSTALHDPSLPQRKSGRFFAASLWLLTALLAASPFETRATLSISWGTSTITVGNVAPGNTSVYARETTSGIEAQATPPYDPIAYIRRPFTVVSTDPSITTAKVTLAYQVGSSVAYQGNQGGLATDVALHTDDVTFGSDLFFHSLQAGLTQETGSPVFDLQVGRQYYVHLNLAIGSAWAGQVLTGSASLALVANSAPTISAIANQATLEDTPITVGFTIGDAETAASALVVTATSSNQGLAPNSNLIISGTGASRALQITPSPNASGTSFITVAVRDADNAVTSRSFQVTVTPVNDAPSISSIPNQTIFVNTSTGPIAFTVGDVDTPASSLVVTAASSNQSLVRDSDIVLGGSEANRTVTITPMAGQTGMASITITVTDTGSLSSSRSFTVTVSELLFADNFTVSSSSVDKNFEYNAGRQSGTVSPLVYKDQNPPAGVIQVNNPDSPGRLRLQPVPAFRYPNLSPNHNFTEAGNFSVEFDLNTGIDDDVSPSGDYWASVVIGATAPNQYPTTSDGFGVLYRNHAGYAVFDGSSFVRYELPGAGFPDGLLPLGEFHVRFEVTTARFQGSPAIIRMYINGVEVRIGNGVGNEYVKATGFFGNWITLGADGDNTITRTETFDNLSVTAYPCISVAQREPVLAIGNTPNALAVRIRPWMNQNQSVSVTLTSQDAGVALPTGGSGASITLNFPAGGATEQFVSVTGVAAGTTQFALSTSSGICVADALTVMIYPDSSPAGFVRREVFSGIDAGRVDSLVNSAKFPSQPDTVTTLTSLETPSNIGDNYGQRVQGFLLPPATGDYVFYISSDDNSELYLSTDENPSQRRLIAAEPQWNSERQWVTGANQASRGTPAANISSPIPLQAGQRYFFEVLHAEGGGGDNLGVTWQLPGALPPVNGSAPIPGQYLAYYTPQAPTTVTFADANLAAAVRTALNIPAGPITDIAMLRLTTLDARGLGIANLGGIEYALRLQSLSLDNNQIRDLSPLARLSRLTGLALGQNQVTSLAPIAGLVNLRELFIWSDPIADLSVLAGLPNLDTLSLNGSTTADLSVIFTLTKLQRLEMFWMNFRDLSLLHSLPNLRYLKLDGNGITDLSPLSTHPNLPFLDLLDLNDNQVQDLTPLVGIEINNLQLANNPGANFAVVGSINGLHHLNLGGNQLADISFLANQTGLIGLGLNYNWISDISALNGITAPGWVALDNNFLDLTAGSPSAAVISTLRGRGATVMETPQNPLPPGLASLRGVSLFAGQSTLASPFTAGDPARAAQIVSVSAASSNPSVIANSDILLGGAGIVRTLQVRAREGAAGSATVTITVSYQDSSTFSASFPVTILPSGPGNFFIEAEDFDSGGGQHQVSTDTMPYLGGAYNGTGAVHGVDYFQVSADPPESDGYRAGEVPNVGIGGSSDSNRGAFNLTANYKVGWNSTGDWYNYTRNFPAGSYNVYARLASGGADEHAQLSAVTSGAGTASQTTISLGNFNGPASGSWDTFGFVPLKTDSGALAAVNLSGLRTLRFTVLPGNLDCNYLAFVPAAAPSGSPPTLVSVFGFNGNKVSASFDQMLDPTTALDPSHYTIAGAAVSEVSLSADAKTILLTVSGLAGNSVTLTVNGIFSAAGVPVAPNTALAGAVSPLNPVDIPATGFAPGALTPLTGHDFDVVAGGNNIGGSQDAFHFDYQQWSGDFDAVVRVTRLDNSGAGALAGLMIRQNFTPGSSEASVSLNPSSGRNNHSAQSRSTQDGPTASWGSSIGTASWQPWLRLKRLGDVLLAYRSADGLTWTKLGQITQHFSDPVLIGLATSPGNFAPGATTVANYRGYTVSANPAPVLQIEAADARASEAGADPGLFKISLIGTGTEPFTANYTTSGTAQAGVDFEPVPLSMTIPAGQTASYVSIKPILNDAADGYRSVTLTLSAVAGIEFESSSATVGIFDDHPAAGLFEREIFRNVPGGRVVDLTSSSKFPNAPSQADVISSIESPTVLEDTLGDFYGERLSGFLIPPATGDYVFYIAADDQAELWLSTDENPAHKVEIAFEPQWNSARNWLGTTRRTAGNPENRSAPVSLAAGQKYYLEVLHKEGAGGDNVAVTWQKPGDQPLTSSAVPIPADFLALRVPLSISMLTPAAIQSGGADFELAVRGAGFAGGAKVLWNGVERSTAFVSERQLSATILASDIAASGLIATAMVAVQNPDGELSNPLVFTIGSADVALVDSTSAPPGSTVTVSTAPLASDEAGNAGVSATFNNTDESSTVTVTAATYSTNPNAGTLFDTGGGFVDLQVVGAHPTDSLAASFYYPWNISPSLEASLVLTYFNGVDWAPVLSSGGATPVKDSTDNLDGTISGGRFTVVFDSSSTPSITSLNGTIFASTTEQIASDHTPPVPDVDPLPILTGECSVTISQVPTATDQVTGRVIGTTGDPLTYSLPGSYSVHWTYNDGNGNLASQVQTVVVLPMSFSGFFSPLAGADATGGSFAEPLRTFKLGSTIPLKFTASCGGVAVLSGIHRLQVVPYTTATTAGNPIDGRPQDAATTGDQFRLADGQWLFNLDTKATGMSSGVWLLRATLSDGSRHSAWIQLK